MFLLLLISMQIIMCDSAVLNCCFFDEQNKEGKSPLHIAAMHGRFTGSQILIQNGNRNDQDSFIIRSVLYNINMSYLHLIIRRWRDRLC